MQSTEPARILIVDDDKMNQMLLSRHLKQAGHFTAFASDGHEAQEKMQADTYDVVLLDYEMPGMDGYEVLDWMMEHDTLRHVPVLMISGMDSMQVIVTCIERGATDYLPKPWDPGLLRARINSSLEKKRAREREMVLFAQVQENYRLLQSLERQRDDLTHMIVHDLRTPLSALLTGMQTLETSPTLDMDDREFVEIAVSGGQRLLGMINDLLDVSKMEDGSMQLRLRCQSPAGLIAASFRQVEELAKQKKLALVAHAAPDLPDFMGDADILTRTLVNLLGNATKFTPVGGCVQASAFVDSETNEIVFSVRDTGEGIPSEAFGRIFERFGQVETRQAGRTASTGLGLTFCKMAVEAHGGHIWVESEMGAGSVFFFALPLTFTSSTSG